MSALPMTQTTPVSSDEELVAAVRRGNDRAFEELYSRYRSRISGYIVGMVGDHGRAEDIAQEVFISALRRLRQTERPIAFKPWIYEIAKNACIDEFRRNRRTREVPLAGDEDDGAQSVRPLISRSPTPDAAIESKQSLSDLRGAFHGLSENHHKVIVMRELEGLSYTQIGERLGMSRPMVESTLFRARRRLTEEYNELISGRRCENVQTLIATADVKSLLKLGVRQRRQLARHLAHCQPCRRCARLAGVDDSLFHAPSLAGKIAALLPLPWMAWRRGVALVRTSLARHTPAAGQYSDLLSSSSGRAVAAAATAAIAGVGGGLFAAIADHHPDRALARAGAVSASPVAAHGSGFVSTVRDRRPPAAAARARSPQATPHRRTAATKSSRSNAGGGLASTGSRTSAVNASAPKASTQKAPQTRVVPRSSSPTTTSQPKLSLPQLPKLPSVSSPGRLLPKVTVPVPPPPATPQLPKVSVPKVQVPKVQAPKL
jgi:RNA polymerase sigma factor (sigma-70 family)